MKKVFCIVLSVFSIFVFCTSCTFAKYTHRNFFELVDDGVQKYQIHRPPGDDDEKTKYPVLINLHGKGENDVVLAYPYFYTAATCYRLIDTLINKINTNPDYEAYVILPIVEDDWGPDPKSVLRIIDTLVEEQSADPNRVYLTGVSMGGFAVSGFIFAYPDVPACAVMICGCSYDSDRVSDIIDIPIRIYHSDDDNIVSVDVSRGFYDGLIQSGGEKAEYFETTGYRHSCWNYAYNNDLIEWMWLQNKFFQHTQKEEEPICKNFR